MSLTSFLDNPDVRERFRQDFKKPRMEARHEIIAEPMSKRFGTVGTAFDYLLRFYIQRLNPNAVDKGAWVAEAALMTVEDHPDIHRKGIDIVSQARQYLDEYLETGRLSDGLLESSIQLATLDPLFRAGTGYDVVGEVHDEDVQDLGNLINAVEPGMFAAKKICLLNPTFGDGTVLVGGADADLVIDDMIIDVKTTKNLKLERRAFDQLLGYFALHELAGVGEIQPKPEISKIAIYFSRHAHLEVMNLSNFIDPNTFPGFLDWFQERAKEAFPPTGN